MKKMLRHMLGGAAIVAFGAVCFTAPIASEQTSAKHLPVQLKDAEGNKIDPNDPEAKPYSPRATCGGCHSYKTISEGYHFQMGADKISDDFGAKSGKTWILSDGMMGKQFHMSYEQLAKKKNSKEAEIALTTYQFAQTCGKCHPGGGLLERDRDGEPYDKRQAAEPALAASFDGDYHKAAWDKSGVLEIDCLLCHQRDYNIEARNAQLTQANFKWAAAAGSGLAAVEGSVKEGQTPKTTYNNAKFAVGKPVIDISKPADRNCLFCHAEAEVKKRGHVWDGRNQDVHTAAGLKCVSCHTSGLDHQILKGRSSEVTVREDLDSDRLSCASCHNEGRLGASKPAHKMVPEDHLKTIACVTCHVRETNVTAVHTVDTTTGKTASIPTAREAKKFGESAKWTPAYFRLQDGKIYSGNALLPSWWGNRVGDVIHPLFLSETGRAYEKVKDVIVDDDGDGKPEANTEAEIKAMLDSIADVLRGGRFELVSPAYVKGHSVHEVKDGRLVESEHPQAVPLRWTFSHNVSPASKAWGAGGCKDCHNSGSSFFNSPVVTDPYGPDGQQVSLPMWQYLCLDEKIITLGQ
jgi:hypothetical protein